MVDIKEIMDLVRNQKEMLENMEEFEKMLPTIEEAKLIKEALGQMYDEDMIKEVAELLKKVETWI